VKKCVACQSEQLKQVDIITRGEEFRLIENGKFTITPQTQKIIKFVCLNCGFINLYAEDYFY